MPQLRSADETVPIAIEDFESFDQLLLSVGVLHLTGHQRQELWEIDRSISICIDFVDHVLELSLASAARVSFLGPDWASAPSWA